MTTQQLVLATRTVRTRVFNLLAQHVTWAALFVIGVYVITHASTYTRFLGIMAIGFAIAVLVQRMGWAEK